MKNLVIHHRLKETLKLRQTALNNMKSKVPDKTRTDNFRLIIPEFMQRIYRITFVLFLLINFVSMNTYAQAPKTISVLELRNYFVKPGHRDEFISYFHDSLTTPQHEMGAKICGTFTIKGQPDHFFWMRGFKDMASRKKMLNDFYYGQYWKAHRNLPNSLLLNNDNVYLLRPVNLIDTDAETSFDSNWFGNREGIAVVDFFISNTKRDQLIAFLKKDYASIAIKSGNTNTSYWISEPELNDFPQLPVFQDKNLVVQISFYKDEAAYHTAIKMINTNLAAEQKTSWYDLVTLQNTVILYPAAHSTTPIKKYK